MASLEELIAAQNAQGLAESNLLSAQYLQQNKEGNAALDTEAGEISPLFDKLINETNQAYKGNIDKARESASEAGTYRSGLRYNKELQIGAQAAQQTGEYGAERVRKLADVQRRRSLLSEKGKVRDAELAKLNAGLGASIADLRYKDYQQKEAIRIENERIAADQAFKAAEAAKDRSYRSGQASADQVTAEEYASDEADRLIAQGVPTNQAWDQVAGLVKSRFGAGVLASGQGVDKLLRSKFLGEEGYRPTESAATGRLGGFGNAPTRLGNALYDSAYGQKILRPQMAAVWKAVTGKTAQR